MNPEDIGRILDEIGERIGPAGEYAWQITVRQVYLEGILWGAVASIFVLLATVALIFIWRDYYERRRQYGAMESPSRYDRPGADGHAFLSVGVVGLQIVATFFGIASVIQLLNPEYHAMVWLLGSIIP